MANLSSAGTTLGGGRRRRPRRDGDSDAAQQLFEREGYVSTTVEAIAAEAGVALKTVYVRFKTKSGVLRALWNLLLRGDDESIPVADRDWYRAVSASPTRSG